MCRFVTACGVSAPLTVPFFKDNLYFFQFLYVCYASITFFQIFFFLLLGPHPQHMEIPRLGIKSELQLPAYATATATPDLNQVCNLYHSSQQRWILNPLSSKARDQTHNFMVPSQIDSFPLCHGGNSQILRLKKGEFPSWCSG